MIEEAPITEKELRLAVRRKLTSRTRDGVRLYEELGIEHGAARIDLALIGKRIEGFELKSDLDSYDRLPNQIHAYNRVFDRITLVTGPVFTESALKIMPAWWGIILAKRTARGLKLDSLREATDNPAQDPYSVAMLLWRNEALAVLRSANAAPPPRASRAELYERVVDSLPWERLRKSVARSLIERELTAPA